MEAYLMPLHDAGVIEPEEERHQWVFHIAVSDRYLDWRDGKLSLASSSVSTGADLASASISDDSSVPLLSASPAFSWEQPSNAWYQEVSTPREP